MINLKNTLGTINFTDWVHVTASKVSDPGTVVWETWIDVPVTNYAFIIPGLDPENYYIRFYDAPTNSSLGTLQLVLIANGLTGEFISERRFYTVDGPGTYDPVNGAATITDPYLIGKTIIGTFKEGFRYFEPGTETTFNDTTGEVAIINGTTFSTGEKFSVEITYNTGVSAPSATGGMYSGTLTVTAATQTLTGADINKRIRCRGTASTQVITLCLLSSIVAEAGYYFDNSVGGTAVQVKILTQGAESVRFNGFNTASDLFAEFWVSKGEHLLLRKFIDGPDTYWEVITDYRGTNVGEKVTVGYKSHANIITEQGGLFDGDEYPRLWWWINNVLPATHKYTDANVEDVFFSPTLSRVGQFVLHPTLKKFRTPTTRGYTERGLADFESYGSDSSNRTIDYPGGFQDEMLLEHGHDVWADISGSSGGVPYALNRTGVGIAGALRTNGNLTLTASGNRLVRLTGGHEQRARNIGVIYGRRI